MLNKKLTLALFSGSVDRLPAAGVILGGFAGKVWKDYKLDDFIDFADDICGIGEYMSSAEESDINLFI